MVASFTLPDFIPVFNRMTEALRSMPTAAATPKRRPKGRK
jgi:hypothetical protein